MHSSLKNIFQSQQVIHWTQRMIKKLLSPSKNLLTVSFSHCRFYVRLPREQNYFL